MILRCWLHWFRHWVQQAILVIAHVKLPGLLPLAHNLLCGEYLLFGGDPIAEFLCEAFRIVVGVVSEDCF